VLKKIVEIYENHHSYPKSLDSGIKLCVVRRKSTDVLNEHVASIFSIQLLAKQETGEKALLATCFHIAFFFGLFFVLKIEGTCSFEMSAGFQRTTRRYNPEDRALHNHSCENLKSYDTYLTMAHRERSIW
jgi:hypothetical protein